MTERFDEINLLHPSSIELFEIYRGPPVRVPVWRNGDLVTPHQ